MSRLLAAAIVLVLLLGVVFLAGSPAEGTGEGGLEGSDTLGGKAYLTVRLLGPDGEVIRLGHPLALVFPGKGEEVDKVALYVRVEPDPPGAYTYHVWVLARAEYHGGDPIEAPPPGIPSPPPIGTPPPDLIALSSIRPKPGYTVVYNTEAYSANPYYLANYTVPVETLLARLGAPVNAGDGRVTLSFYAIVLVSGQNGTAYAETGTITFDLEYTGDGVKP